MNAVPLVSIIINNFNYGKFLPLAIRSALHQTYPAVEVIVVDDGSTDDSVQHIRSFGDAVSLVLKANGGQASALNAGWRASHGEILCFLDADDEFFPEKVEEVVKKIGSSGVLHHRLRLEPGGSLLPLRWPLQSHAYSYAEKHRFLPYQGAPTSGISLTRSLAEQLFPLPEVRSSADDFLVRGAALVSHVTYLDAALGLYRVHGENIWYSHGKKKSDAFMKSLETYLNALLVRSGKKPVIDFMRSMYAREFVQRRPSKLFRLAFTVFAHHQSAETFRFFLRTLMLAVSSAVKHPEQADAA